MSQKTVTAHVYGKEYTLACDSGQEQHLHTLIADMNSRITTLEKAVGKLPEPLMLLYSGDDARLAALEEEVALSLDAIATRIEGLADKLAA